MLFYTVLKPCFRNTRKLFQSSQNLMDHVHRGWPLKCQRIVVLRVILLRMEGMFEQATLAA